MTWFLISVSWCSKIRPSILIYQGVPLSQRHNSSRKHAFSSPFSTYFFTRNLAIAVCIFPRALSRKVRMPAVTHIQLLSLWSRILHPTHQFGRKSAKAVPSFGRDHLGLKWGRASLPMLQLLCWAHCLFCWRTQDKYMYVPYIKYIMCIYNI